jgi:tryptophan-rich sensory protein
MARLSRLEIGKLIGCIAICEGIGLLGSVFTAPAIDTWYAALVKPGFTPPNAVFGPVWTTLYALMGVALFLVWRRGLAVPGVKPAFILFWVQLGVNLSWSIVFFGDRSILGGLVIIISLWVLVLITMLRFFRISKTAGSLLVPYLVWLSIATALNIQIWRLN